MFRKKKGSGDVILLDEELPKQDKYTDLGLDQKQDKGLSEEEVQNMTSQQLEQLVASTANVGKESTARALRIATEAREIGATTATTMQQQTAQLEAMSEQIEVVHDYLDKSERTIEKMTKPKIVRMFQRKMPTGKGLDNVKGTRKEKEAREALRTKGLESLDVKGMENQTGSVAMHDIQRNDLLNGSTAAAPSSSNSKLKWLGKKNRGPPSRVETRDIREDYSEYSSGVAQVLKQQDDDLDQIGDALADMKTMATAMNSELDYQGELIEEVQAYSSETSRRTKENAKKIAKIK